MSQALTLPSFAKINWVLDVLGRRDDGYHEVRTVLQTVSLRDTLRLRAIDGDRLDLTCSDDRIPVDDRNLVIMAARALRRRYGLRKGAAIHLEKIIPAGGGLGGGSSNAAAALMGLCYVWGIPASPGELIELGREIGADVPFFFVGGTARGTGRGTELSPLPDVEAPHILIVTPGVQVATEIAYRALNMPALTKGTGDNMLSVSRARGELFCSLNASLRNSFERVIFDLEPEIGRARNALLDAGACGALLSGSGSSVFGIFDNKNQAALAEARLGTLSGWRIFSCAAVGREEYRQSLGPAGVFLQ